MLIGFFDVDVVAPGLMDMLNLPGSAVSFQSEVALTTGDRGRESEFLYPYRQVMRSFQLIGRNSLGGVELFFSQVNRFQPGLDGIEQEEIERNRVLVDLRPEWAKKALFNSFQLA